MRVIEWRKWSPGVLVEGVMWFIWLVRIESTL